jgi:hypothetical protein
MNRPRVYPGESEEIFIRQPEITLRIRRRNTPFISPKEFHSLKGNLPLPGAGDNGREQLLGHATARQRDQKFAPGKLGGRDRRQPLLSDCCGQMIIAGKGDELRFAHWIT